MTTYLIKRSVGIFILCTCLLGATGCDRIAGSYYYRTGEKSFFAGNYSEAIKGFDGSIKYGYQLRESFVMRAMAHYMKGE